MTSEQLQWCDWRQLANGIHNMNVRINDNHLTVLIISKNISKKTTDRKIVMKWMSSYLHCFISCDHFSALSLLSSSLSTVIISASAARHTTQHQLQRDTTHLSVITVVITVIIVIVRCHHLSLCSPSHNTKSATTWHDTSQCYHHHCPLASIISQMNDVDVDDTDTQHTYSGNITRQRATCSVASQQETIETNWPLADWVLTSRWLSLAYKQRPHPTNTDNFINHTSCNNRLHNRTTI